MKTSNKLLLGFLSLILAGIVALAITFKVYIDKDSVKGNGKSTSQIREIGTFNKISTRGRFTVFLTQGEKTQLKINADENLIPIVESEVEGGELTIKLKNKIGRGDKVELYLTADSSLDELKIASQSSIETTSELTGEKLKIETTAGGRGKLKVRYKELFNESHAGGDLTLIGISNIATFLFSSGGAINAEELVVNKGKAEGSSGGHASITVNETLDADVSSGAALNYGGTAIINKMNQSSGGSVNKR